MDRRVAEANIEHFRRLLTTETDPTKRETLARLLIGQAKAGFAEPAAGDGERDHLAVDQHAVAIENDDFGPARHSSRPASSSASSE